MEVSGQFQAPAALPLGINPQHEMDKGLLWAQIRSGRSGEEKNLTLAGIRTTTIQTQPVAVPIEH
jgi:hypothetical protein